MMHRVTPVIASRETRPLLPGCFPTVRLNIGSSGFSPPGTIRGDPMRTYWYAVVLLLLGGMPRAVVAQAGVPGGRLETGSAQRAADRAEAYKSVSKFFDEWREA